MFYYIAVLLTEFTISLAFITLLSAWKKRVAVSALLQALFTVTRLATMSERVNVLCGGDLDSVFNY